MLKTIKKTSISGIKIKISIMYFIFILNTIGLTASSVLDTRLISLSLEDISIEQMLQEVEKQSDITIIYRADIFNGMKSIDIDVTNESINYILNKTITPLGFEYSIENSSIVITKRKDTPKPEPKSKEKKTISGQVKDDTNGLLPGVTVFIKGTTNGTISDIDGNYSISEVSNDDVLVFSFVGMTKQEIKVAAQNVINVSMAYESELLDDLVVTALGLSRKEKALGYAVTEVKGDELNVVKNINAVNSLSGKVAGVDIVQANTGVGGSSKVTIRGNSKITGSNQPLYVIDGVPMDNATLGEASQYGGQDLGDGISSINPDDIESMSVLKGPAASALYGSRASNGVVLITTKSWKKDGDNKFRIDVTSNFSIENVVGQYDDLQQVYGQGIGTPPKDIGDATGMWSWGVKMDPTLQFISFDGQYRDYGLKKDNITSFFQTAQSYQNTISFSGGNEGANFRFSASDVRMDDIVPNSNLNRNSFNLRGTIKMWEKLKLDTKINYINEDVDNRPYLGYSGANTALALIGLPASFDQNWLKESTVDAHGDYIYWNSATRIINPYFSLYEMENNSKKNRVLGYATLTYDINNWLNLRVKAGMDTYSYLYYNYSPISTPLAEWGEMRQLNSRTTEINSEFLLSAKKKLTDDIEVNASVGGNMMNFDNYTTDILAKGQVTRELVSINNYEEFTLIHSNPRKRINSLYAFANVAYKDYVYVDLTARNDWSSTLPEANNSYFYPSITSAILLTNVFEQLESDLLSFAKIRASYAEVGGDTDPYQLSRTYSNYPYTMDGNQLTSESSSIMPNPGLKPSRTKGHELGLDAKFLNWRVGLDLTYYNQTTYDEIITLPISSASAYDYAYINAGEINNKGYEVMLNIVPIKTNDFRWDLTFNYARNINKVIALHDDAKIQEIARADWVSSYIQAAEGGTYGDIVGYDFQYDPDGNIIVDQNGQPIRSEEQVVIGNGQYDFTGGITNTLSYKGFTLRALIDIKYGADMLSMTNMKLHQYGMHEATVEGREGWALSEKERLAANVTSDNWTATDGYLANAVVATTDDSGVTTYSPNTTFVDPRDYWANISNKHIMSQFVYDASYVKLRELQISYKVSGDILKKTKVIKGATVSLVGRNLWLIWSNLPNIDPESTYSVSNGQGYEYGSLPQRRSWGINMNLNF